jgi:hypothetical protein
MTCIFQSAARASLCAAVCLVILSGLAAPTSLSADDGGGTQAAVIACPCSRCLNPSPDYCPDKTPPLCAGGLCNTPDAGCVTAGATCNCRCGSGGASVCSCF